MEYSAVSLINNDYQNLASLKERLRTYINALHKLSKGWRKVNPMKLREETITGLEGAENWPVWSLLGMAFLAPESPAGQDLDTKLTLAANYLQIIINGGKAQWPVEVLGPITTLTK